MTVATMQANISRDDISALVALFYARVRQHTRLGPIFHAKIGQTDEAWAPHLEKIENFWANVIRHERVYSGNPMQVHLSVPGIQPEDFAIWLDLFERAAHDCLPKAKASVMSQTARRIGRSLAMGVERANTSGPPRLSL